MNGLIHALQLDGNGGARELSWDEAIMADPGNGVVWIHLDYTVPEAAEWIGNQAGVGTHVAQALLDSNTRPRAHEYPGGLLVALRGVNLNPGQDPEDMVAIRLWIEQGRIISTRQRPLLSIREIAAALIEGHGPKSAGGVVVQLTRRLIARMSGVIEMIEDETTDLEEQMLATSTVQARDQLSQLRRQIIGLKRYLSPQREAMEVLHQLESGLFTDEHRMGLRESNERLIRYIEDLNESRERAAVLHEETINRASDLMNQRMYVLSLVAAIFLPLGFLTGLFGINIGGMPGVESPRAFGLFTVALVVTTGVMLWYFKVKRWL